MYHIYLSLARARQLGCSWTKDSKTTLASGRQVVQEWCNEVWLIRLSLCIWFSLSRTFRSMSLLHAPHSSSLARACAYSGGVCQPHYHLCWTWAMIVLFVQALHTTLSITPPSCRVLIWYTLSGSLALEHSLVRLFRWFEPSVRSSGLSGRSELSSSYFSGRPELSRTHLSGRPELNPTVHRIQVVQNLYKSFQAASLRTIELPIFCHMVF